MTGAIVMLGGITLCVVIFTVLDGIAHRRRLRDEARGRLLKP
jgi:hypothetical protein